MLRAEQPLAAFKEAVPVDPQAEHRAAKTDRIEEGRAHYVFDDVRGSKLLEMLPQGLDQQGPLPPRKPWQMTHPAVSLTRRRSVNEVEGARHHEIGRASCRERV